MGTTDSHDFDHDSLETERQRLLAILDGIDDVIYISDPVTHELLLINSTFKKTWGEDTLGEKCYRILQQRDAPCPFCTNDKILGEYLGRAYVWEFQNEVTKQWYRCSDKAIRWSDGRMVRFELASNITASKQTARALQERVKELICMQQISNTIQREDVAIEQVLQRCARALQASWQHPEHAVVRITVDDDIHEAGDFSRCTARLAASIHSGGAVVGSVEVGYTQQKPSADEGPFLLEERKLINAVAELLGTAVSRWRSEQRLREHQDHLEDAIRRRTAELDSANDRLKALTSKVINVQEDERKRVSRELHDSIGQILAALKMDAEWIASHTSDDQEIQQLATRLSTNLSETIATVRDVIRDLRPPILDDAGVASAIESHAAELSRRFDFCCSTEMLTDSDNVPPIVATTIFRVTQEALNNVVRHARARHAMVTFEDTGDEVILSVRDDGKGITDEAINSNTSMGIIGMHERVALLGGTLTISSEKEHGTTITVNVPYSLSSD